MSKAQTCPVCLGKGKLPDKTHTTAMGDIICHGCQGTGWVIVGD